MQQDSPAESHADDGAPGLAEDVLVRLEAQRADPPAGEEHALPHLGLHRGDEGAVVHVDTRHSALQARRRG
eukprot:11175560-Lingulodinium_polyedra.AAC.1